jgi:hypothetical protein
MEGDNGDNTAQVSQSCASLFKKIKPKETRVFFVKTLFKIKFSGIYRVIYVFIM